MQRTPAILGILLLAAWVVFSGFTPRELKKDFVSLDRAFIPALALTKNEKAKPSMNAMRLFKQEWHTFRAKYDDANPKDPQWNDDLDRIGKAIEEADQIVTSGKNLKEAHESLEAIRDITLNLRKRNNIGYYLDLLNEFHPFMEEIFHFGDDNAPDGLTVGAIKSIEETLFQAKAKWTKVENTPLDQDIFGLTDEKVKKMRKLITLERDALNALSVAIQADDRPEIVKASRGVQPNYAKLFKMFGDFEAVMK